MLRLPVWLARSAATAALALVVWFAPLALGPAANAEAPSPHPVEINIDIPNPGYFVINGRSLVVGGWAVATGTTNSGIRSVNVSFDSPNGPYLGSADLGIQRPDVARLKGHPEWSYSGFNFNWIARDVSADQHMIYVTAYSVNGDSATASVPIVGCGCGLNYTPSITNPAVRQIPGVGWELDTGGPGTWIQRDDRWWR